MSPRSSTNSTLNSTASPGDAEAERDAAHQALADANRKIGGILNAIGDGAYHPTLKERLTQLEREKAAAAARLAASQSKPVLRLHPNLPTLYQKKVQRLAAALNEPGTAAEAGEIIRGLIDRIVLTSYDGIFEGGALRRSCGHHGLCRR